MSGLACDFTSPSFGTPLEVCNAIKPHLVALEVDQLIWEFATWCHLAIGGKVRHQCLTIDSNGTRAGSEDGNGKNFRRSFQVSGRS